MKKPGIMEKLDRRYGNHRAYQFLRELRRRTREDRVNAVGAQLAYYLVLSFFPFLLFLLALVPYTPLASEQVLSQILSAVPGQSRSLIEPIIQEIANERSPALLSTALILALWSGSSGMANLLESMGSAFDITNARSTVLKRAFAVLFTTMLAVMILLALVSQVFGDQIIQVIENTIGGGNVIGPVWTVARTVLPFLVMILGFALLFKFGPGFPANFKVTFREALLGGAFTAALWTLISLLFSLYVENFSNYSRTYGSLGGVIILLLWLYMTSVVIMLGNEINASYVAIFKGGLKDRNTQRGKTADPAHDPKRGDEGSGSPQALQGTGNQPVQPGSVKQPGSVNQPVQPGPQPICKARQPARQGSQALRQDRQTTRQDSQTSRAVPESRATRHERLSRSANPDRKPAAGTARMPAACTARPSELFSRRPERERAVSTLITAGLMFWLLQRRSK